MTAYLKIVKESCLKKVRRKGKLFVISAPSGSGKTTLCQRLMENFTGPRKLVRSISMTTRLMRWGECCGRDYFFISKEEFRKRKRAGQFLEWARVLGNYYGTPGEFVRRHLRRGDDVLLSIDVQGALEIKRKVPEAIFIFVLPPSLKELRRRLLARSTESRQEIIRRLRLAKKEMAFVKKYDYVVLNAQLNRAQQKLREIIKTERER